MAADLNNERITAYAGAVRQVALEQDVGYVDVLGPTKPLMASPGNDLTFNGAHLNEAGYRTVSRIVFQQMFGEPAPKIDEQIRQVVIDKNRQYFRRYRPLNTFYYTGGRRKSYG